MVSPTKQKKQFGVFVQARTDRVERGRNVFAHFGPVGARAIQPDFDRLGEQARVSTGHDLHDVRGEPPLQEVQERAHAAGAFRFQRLPSVRFNQIDIDFDSVKVTSTYQRAHDSGSNVQIDDRTVPNVTATAGEPVGIVAVRFEVRAPGFAPEAPGNRPAVDADWTQFLPVSFPGLYCFLRAATLFGSAHI